MRQDHVSRTANSGNFLHQVVMISFKAHLNSSLFREFRGIYCIIVQASSCFEVPHRSIQTRGRLYLACTVSCYGAQTKINLDFFKHSVMRVLAVALTVVAAAVPMRRGATLRLIPRVLKCVTESLLLQLHSCHFTQVTSSRSRAL